MNRSLRAGLASCFILSAPYAAEPAKGLSARAIQIKNMESRERDALDARCQVKANWQTPDCVARREAEAARVAVDPIHEEKELKYRRAVCAGGDQGECESLACPTDGAMMLSGSIDVAKACARYRKLPITKQWAQTSDVHYICLHPMKFLDKFGAPFTVLPDTSVSRRVSGNSKTRKYVVQAIAGREFDSKEEAATAGCEIARPLLKEFFTYATFVE